MKRVQADEHREMCLNLMGKWQNQDPYQRSGPGPVLSIVGPSPKCPDMLIAV